MLAAAPGKVVFIGWDNWVGQRHDREPQVGRVERLVRTIYMHLPQRAYEHDIDASWNETVPTLKDEPAKGDYSLTNYNAAVSQPALALGAVFEL